MKNSVILALHTDKMYSEYSEKPSPSLNYISAVSSWVAKGLHFHANSEDKDLSGQVSKPEAKN